MKIQELTPHLSVSAQITPTDLKFVKQQGFGSIICNRPDGESADQPTFAKIANVAKELGLQTYYLPIASGNVSDEEATEFGKVMGELPGPTLVYCRSGMRSTILHDRWAAL